MIMDGRSGATAVLGMGGFVAGDQLEVDGEVWILVETTADVAGCLGCGIRAVGNGRRVVRIRDLPAGDRPVVLVWRKRTWRCVDDQCLVGSFSEETDAIAPRASLAERARAEICRRVGAEGHSVAQVAAAFGRFVEVVKDHCARQGPGIKLAGSDPRPGLHLTRRAGLREQRGSAA